MGHAPSEGEHGEDQRSVEAPSGQSLGALHFQFGFHTIGISHVSHTVWLLRVILALQSLLSQVEGPVDSQERTARSDTMRTECPAESSCEDQDSQL